MTKIPPPPGPPARYSGGWTQTGRWRWRRRFLFGPVLEVEVERDVWAPKFAGWTPQNWRKETKWWRGEGCFDYPPEGRVGP